MFFVGVALLVLVAGFYVYALPRGDKLAPFVGTLWETPLTLGATVSLFLGLVLIIAG
jgi:hypothetical protein